MALLASITIVLLSLIVVFDLVILVFVANAGRSREELEIAEEKALRRRMLPIAEDSDNRNAMFSAYGESL